MEKASLRIGGEECAFFTRNPPDASGRPSITIVDGNSPSVIVAGLPLASIGPVVVEGAELSDDGTAGLTAGGTGKAYVHVAPKCLYLWNTQHLHLVYRKTVTNDEAGMFVELTMEGGGRIAIAEGEGEGEGEGIGPPRDAMAGFWLPPANDANAWVSRTIPVAALVWAAEPGERPPLPLGRVVAVTFGLTDSRLGDRLNIDAFMALRPSTNGEAEAGAKIVGGRVTVSSGKPPKGVRVNMVDETGHVLTVTTDRDGYYLFTDVPRGAKVSLGLDFKGIRHSPISGEWQEIWKNELEMDFLLGKR